MSECGKVLNECTSSGGEGGEHYYRFINKFIKIPDYTANKVNTDHSDQKIGMRHCIGLILSNLIKYGAVAYFRRDSYYAEHKDRYYTKTKFSSCGGFAC